MSKPFSKLNFSLPFSMETAVPVDYNSYFTSYEEASAAAYTAMPAGSNESQYYIGQQLYVVDDTEHTVKTYLISHDRTLTDIGKSFVFSNGLTSAQASDSDEWNVGLDTTKIVAPSSATGYLEIADAKRTQEELQEIIGNVNNKIDKVSNPVYGNVAILDGNGGVANGNMQLSELAPKESPAFSGTPTTPTPTSLSTVTQIANVEYVNTTIDSLNKLEIDDSADVQNPSVTAVKSGYPKISRYNLEHHNTTAGNQRYTRSGFSFRLLDYLNKNGYVAPVESDYHTVDVVINTLTMYVTTTSSLSAYLLVRERTAQTDFATSNTFSMGTSYAAVDITFPSNVKFTLDKYYDFWFMNAETSEVIGSVAIYMENNYPISDFEVITNSGYRTVITSDFFRGGSNIVVTENYDIELSKKHEAVNITTELSDLPRAYSEYIEALPDADQAGGQNQIFILPSAFGATSNCIIRSFTIRTSNVSHMIPHTMVYAKLKDPDAVEPSDSVVMVSRPVYVSSTYTEYTFIFDDTVLLPFTKQYRIDFENSPDSDALPINVPLRLSPAQSTTQEIYYGIFTNRRPIMKVLYSDSTTQSNASKVNTAIQGVLVNGTELSPDSNRKVSVTVPVASTSLPQIASANGNAGSATTFSKGDHVHPAETRLEHYSLADDCLPITYVNGTQINDIGKLTFKTTSSGIEMRLYDSTVTGGYGTLLCTFDSSTLKVHTVSATDLQFNGKSPTLDSWPSIVADDAVTVRNVEVVRRTDFSTKIDTKMDADAGAPDFDPTVTYYANEWVNYGGKLWSCHTDVSTPGPWTGTDNWTQRNMSSPDVTLDITSHNALRIMDSHGNRLWMQGYDFVTPTVSSDGSAALSNEAVNHIEFGVNSSEMITLILPSGEDGKVADFVLDVYNPPLDSTADNYPSAWDIGHGSYSKDERVVKDGKVWICTYSSGSTSGSWVESEWQTTCLAIDGFDSTVGIVIADDDDFQDMFMIQPDEMSEFYFTQTSFDVDGLPTYKVSKQVVVNAAEAST